MRRATRYSLGLAAAAAIASLVALVPFAAGASRANATLVVTKGKEIFDVNGGAVATFRFEPQVITVPSGSTITWRHGDSGSDPHSITIVTNKRELPHDFEGANCRACQAAQKGHFSGKRPVPILNAGRPGLDRAGDSLLMRPKHGSTVSAVVSAPAGTMLYYVCIIHPWMQGVIKVI